MKNLSSRARKVLVSLALAIATFAGFAFFMNWKFSLFLMGSILFHELGHIWAMRRCGMRVTGLYFVPFISAMVQTNAFPSCKAEAFVALMGPLWGFLQSAVMLAVAVFVDSALLASLALLVAIFNLFNLIPAHPMDGGRAVRVIAYSISPRLALAVVGGGLATVAVAGAYFAPLVAAFVLFLGLREFRSELWWIRAMRDRERIVAALGELLQVKPTAEAVQNEIAAVRRRMRDPQAPPPETLIRVSGQGDPALEAKIRELPFWHAAVQTMLWSRFEELVIARAHAARREYRTLFRRKPYFITPALGSTISSLGELTTELERNMPQMNWRQIGLTFIGYSALAGALYGVICLAKPLADRAALFAFMFTN